MHFQCFINPFILHTRGFQKQSSQVKDSRSELSNDTLFNIRKMQSFFPTLVRYSLHFAWKTISFILSLFSFFHKNEFLCVELLFTSIEFCPRHLFSWRGDVPFSRFERVSLRLSFPFFFTGTCLIG